MAHGRFWLSPSPQLFFFSHSSVRKSVTRLSHVSILSRILIRFSRLLSARNKIGVETGLFSLIFLISFIACRTCSPYIARVSRSKSASQSWREKRKKNKQKKNLAPVLQSTSFIDT